jgi:hypothetical protein
MRYPLNAHSKELASADEARERERELVSRSFFPVRTERVSAADRSHALV